jgi:hypothetical protein
MMIKSSIRFCQKPSLVEYEEDITFKSPSGSSSLKQALLLTTILLPPPFVKFIGVDITGTRLDSDLAHQLV